MKGFWCLFWIFIFLLFNPYSAVAQEAESANKKLSDKEQHQANIEAKKLRRKQEKTKKLEEKRKKKQEKINKENEKIAQKEEKQLITKKEAKLKLKQENKNRRLNERKRKLEIKKNEEEEKKNFKKYDRKFEQELLSTIKDGVQAKLRTEKIIKLEKIDALMPTRFAFRASAGLGLGELRSTNGNNLKTNLGFGEDFGFGVSANIPMSRIPNSWRFQPEFNIKMAFMNGLKPNLASTSTILNYYALQIPLLINLCARPDLHLYLGPSIYITMDVVNKSGVSLRNAVNIFNFGAIAGISYLLRYNLALDLRYNRRFLPIYKPNNANLKTTVPALMQNSLTHNNLELALVYYFKRRKPIKDITSSNLGDLYQDGDIFNLSKQIDPNDDSDGDGVPYFKDACPTEIGSLWNNGCPADNDRDGIPNFKDSCLNIAGVLYNDGCPANDKDKDGIIDQLDACPNEKGPLNNKGCPVNINAKDSISIENKSIVVDNLGYIPFSNKDQNLLDNILNGIIFVDKKAKIADISLNSVKNLAKFILKRKTENTYFIIFANTLSKKSSKYNRNISELRVEKLVRALYKEGVSNDDIHYEGREDRSSMDQGNVIPKTTLQLVWHKNSNDKQKRKRTAKKLSKNKTNTISQYSTQNLAIPDSMSSSKNLSFREARALELSQEMSKNLEFSNGKTKFRSKSLAFEVLEKVVSMMKEHMDMNLIIHFLYVGSKEEKKIGKIARARGNLLIKLLSKNGIAIERIITKIKDMPLGQKTSNLLYEFSINNQSYPKQDNSKQKSERKKKVKKIKRKNRQKHKEKLDHDSSLMSNPISNKSDTNTIKPKSANNTPVL